MSVNNKKNKTPKLFLMKKSRSPRVFPFLLSSKKLQIVFKILVLEKYLSLMSKYFDVSDI